MYETYLCPELKELSKQFAGETTLSQSMCLDNKIISCMRAGPVSPERSLCGPQHLQHAQHIRNMYLVDEYMCYRQQLEIKSVSRKTKENLSLVTYKA